jgi:hypothetical protein
MDKRVRLPIRPPHSDANRSKVAKRANPRGCQLARGFLLGLLYGRGFVLTTARIRKELRVSRATAKRDMVQIRKLVPVRSSKPAINVKRHLPQATVPLKKAA